MDPPASSLARPLPFLADRHTPASVTATTLQFCRAMTLFYRKSLARGDWHNYRLTCYKIASVAMSRLPSAEFLRMKIADRFQDISTSSRPERVAAYCLRTPSGAANVVVPGDFLASLRKALQAVETIERRWRRSQAERLYRCN